MPSTAEVVKKYFPEIDPTQEAQFNQLPELYQHWNAQINVISRKDMDHFVTRHVLHSLAIAKCLSFSKGSKMFDIGTGGGFPGIPLAILFPECQFHLVDSIGKKIKVVQEVSSALGLTNVTSEHNRAEKIKGKYDFVISRAVTRLSRFMPWIQNNIHSNQINAWPNGLLYLKGGDLTEEIKEARVDAEVIPLKDLFEDDFFLTKAVVYVKMV